MEYRLFAADVAMSFLEKIPELHLTFVIFMMVASEKF